MYPKVPPEPRKIKKKNGSLVLAIYFLPRSFYYLPDQPRSIGAKEEMKHPNLNYSSKVPQEKDSLRKILWPDLKYLKNCDRNQ